MQSRRESVIFYEISVLACVAYTLRRKEEIIMREGIHPDYYQAKVVCKQQKAIQARGRIDKFNKKYGVQANN